jgi:hypothetical protein
MIDYTLKNSRVVVAIPETPDEWELYATSMDCTAAAAELTACLEVAIDELDNITFLSSLDRDELMFNMYATHMRPAMMRHIDKGAMDTEPRNIALQTLEYVICALCQI